MQNSNSVFHKNMLTNLFLNITLLFFPKFLHNFPIQQSHFCSFFVFGN